MNMTFHTVQGALYIPISSKLLDNSWERNHHSSSVENLVIPCTLSTSTQFKMEDDFWTLQNLLENFMSISAENPKVFMANLKLDENGFDIEIPMKAGVYKSICLLTLNTDDKELLSVLHANYAYHLGVEYANQMVESKRLKEGEE